MNICYLSRDYPPNLLGGVGSYTYEMAQVLTKLGNGVFVITEAISTPSESIEDGISIFRVKPKHLSFLDPFRAKLKRTIERLEYSAAVSQKLKEIVNAYKLDIVESCEARAEGFWYYLTHKNPPLVIKLHTPESIACQIDNLPFDLDAKLVDKLEEFWIFKSNKIVAVTHAIIRLVSDYYKFHFLNLPVVYYPIDTDLFRPGLNMSGEDYPQILYAGRLEIRKGVIVLLETIPLILKHFPEAKFYFVGQDAGVKYLMQKRIIELGCSLNIIFKDRVNRKDMVKIFHSVDLCAFPSLWENFAYVALEAMACGKAVVVSRVGGFCEMIDDGINGILCEPNDHKDLAEKIVSTLKDKLLIKRLGLEARKKIVNNYSPLKIAKEMLKVYEQVIQ